MVLSCPVPIDHCFLNPVSVNPFIFVRDSGQLQCFRTHYRSTIIGQHFIRRILNGNYFCLFAVSTFEDEEVRPSEQGVDVRMYEDDCLDMDSLDTFGYGTAQDTSLSYCTFLHSPSC